MRALGDALAGRPVPLLLGIAILSTAPLVSAAPAVPEGELVELCDSLAERHAFSGVLLVARGDEILAEGAYGFADAEGTLPNDVETRFLVASLTKSVVAFLALRLVDQGLLGLEDPVSQHIAGLGDAPVGGATVHQLLTHTSGLPHYEGWPGFLDTMEEVRDDVALLELLARTELVGEVGSEHRYSGPGYLLLGLILERAAGEPLPALLSERVFTPLGMSSSSLLDATGASHEHAMPLVRAGESLQPARSRHPSTLRAAGGLVTTARDLHRFARAIQRGELLSEESHATLLRPVDSNYACGLIVYSNPWTGERFARHMGNMDGVAAHFVFGLEDERVCVALANVAPSAVNRIDDALMAKTTRVAAAGEPGDAR